MIKRVEKDFDNVYGLAKVNDEISLDRPILLTMFPINTDASNINGYLSKLLYLLQIRSLKVDSNYTIGSIPFDIVSSELRDNTKEIIAKNIPVGDLQAAKKFMRNISILSYCDGNYDTTRLLNDIYDYLELINYTEDEIDEIMKEIFVVQIVDTNYMDDDGSFFPIPYATTVIIQDVYDKQNETHVIDFNSDNPFISTMKIDGVRYMLYSSFGDDSLMEVDREHSFTDDYILAPVVNAVIALYLIKAISMSLSDIPRVDISIYKELQVMINIAQEYINSLNKTPEELTKEEKDELNKMLFEEIKKVFLQNISCKELSDDEKNYLMMKDKTLKILNSSELTSVIDNCKKCITLINSIIDTYNNYSYGDIVGKSSTGSSSIGVDVTRESFIKEKITLLEEIFSNINQAIEKLEHLESIPDILKVEYLERINTEFNNVKDMIFSEDFLNIIKDVLDRDSILINNPYQESSTRSI